jgi:hypothetical protein
VSKAPSCAACRVLEQQVAHLQGLVDRLMQVGPPPLPGVATAPPLGPTDAPPVPPEVPFQIRGEDGVEYVITPDGTLDTKANYERAMSMLDRTLAGKPSYDQGDTEPEGDTGG